MANDMPFRIEADGPALGTKSPLYGAGEVACPPGPVIAERGYANPCLGVVIEGAFDYRSPSGRGLATQGAVVFGNAGEPFVCRRLEPAGNRRAVVAFDPAVLEDVANDCALPAPLFGSAVAPASRAAATIYGAARRAAAGRLSEDEALLLIGQALRLSYGQRRCAKPSAADAARIGAALKAMEAAFDQPLPLDTLARIAGLSRYHFVRVFRAVTGESPHQKLIGLRLRAAADRLLDTCEPVTEIAFSVGFNDLSHFNATFRRVFGRPPGIWRRAA
jgi:AraC-like DNA-binding protein